MTASTNISNDSNLNNSNKLQGGDFNMKHRLTGAGLLISFGVVVLPWLLGSYSISADGDATHKDSVETVAENENNSVDNSISINDDEEIKVFVSKIKPVDSKGRQIYQAQKSEAKKTEVAPPKNDIVKSNDVTSVEKVKETLKSNLDQKIGPEKTRKITDTVKAKAEEVAKANVIAAPKKTETQKKDIEQGYIVSVGVYLKRDGAQRVIDDLQKKGFKPSSSESKSSKGLATRVWLGPFSTRAAAGKERSKLEQIIGEKGWIIRYP